MDFVVLKIILTVLKSRSEFDRMRVAPMWISEGMKLLGTKRIQLLSPVQVLEIGWDSKQ